MKTLQEKIDMLPEIEYKGNIYRKRFAISLETVFVEYYCVNPYEKINTLIHCGNALFDKSLSQRLEDVVDTALDVIQNKKWLPDERDEPQIINS